MVAPIYSTTRYPSPSHGSVSLLNFGRFGGLRLYPTMVLIFISLTTNEVRHLFVYSQPKYLLSVNDLIKTLVHFSGALSIFSLIDLESCVNSGNNSFLNSLKIFLWHPILLWLHPNWLHLQWPYFWIWSHSKVQGVRISMYELGGRGRHNSSTTQEKLQNTLRWKWKHYIPRLTTYN